MACNHNNLQNNAVTKNEVRSDIEEIDRIKMFKPYFGFQDHTVSFRPISLIYMFNIIKQELCAYTKHTQSATP